MGIDWLNLEIYQEGDKFIAYEALSDKRVEGNLIDIHNFLLQLLEEIEGEIVQDE